MQPYSATFTDDVHVVIRTLRGRFLTAPLVAVGFSLGAVILTKYLSEAGRGQWGAEGVQGMKDDAAMRRHGTSR